MPIVFSIVDFPPFGFVLKPFWSIYMFLNMIMAILVELAFLGVG